MKTLKQLIKQTKKITKKFPNPHWKAETRFVEFS